MQTEPFFFFGGGVNCYLKRTPLLKNAFPWRVVIHTGGSVRGGGGDAQVGAYNAGLHTLELTQIMPTF